MTGGVGLPRFVKVLAYPPPHQKPHQILIHRLVPKLQIALCYYCLMNLERYKAKVGISQLTHILDEIGEQGLLSLIVEKLAEGTKPSDVARDLHLPFMVLWEWLGADEKRMKAYNHGWEMYANDLHAETVQIADEATTEDVAVARLRVDTRFKAAGNYDKKRFGAEKQQDVRGFAGGVTIVIGEVKSPYLQRDDVQVLEQQPKQVSVDKIDVPLVEARPQVAQPAFEELVLEQVVAKPVLLEAEDI